MLCVCDLNRHAQISILVCVHILRSSCTSGFIPLYTPTGSTHWVQLKSSTGFVPCMLCSKPISLACEGNGWMEHKGDNLTSDVALGFKQLSLLFPPLDRLYNLYRAILAPKYSDFQYHYIIKIVCVHVFPHRLERHCSMWWAADTRKYNDVSVWIWALNRLQLSSCKSSSDHTGYWAATRLTYTVATDMTLSLTDPATIYFLLPRVPHPRLSGATKTLCFS